VDGLDWASSDAGRPSNMSGPRSDRRIVKDRIFEIKRERFRMFDLLGRSKRESVRAESIAMRREARNAEGATPEVKN
jgi:hypothetical protein